MLEPQERIHAFSKLAIRLSAYLEQPDHPTHLEINKAVTLAGHKNGWFTPREIHRALKYWAQALDAKSLEKFLDTYTPVPKSPKNIGLILAGNIPMVGFHDVLCTLLTGHNARIKCSSNDDVLIPLLLNLLCEIEPKFSSQISIVSGLLTNYDAAIATGSNNSARHFENYFKKIPHIIRKNRTSAAIINGDESSATLENLMDDAFSYYGLGCRNVTKLFLPAKFDLNEIFKASTSFAYLMDNKKYANNHNYYKTLYMMQRKPVLENGLILMLEDRGLFSPVGVLHYEYYTSLDEVQKQVQQQKNDLQCLIGKSGISAGSAQNPLLTDYADGVDTMKFLITLPFK